MFAKPSLMSRIAIGKLLGLLVGLGGFVFLRVYAPETDPLFTWGILLWYTTLGAIVGVYGVFTYHPILHLPMPWWFRAPLIGAWMNFVLTLFTYDTLKSIITLFLNNPDTKLSPFWFALEGAIVALLIGYFATRFGGEGKETVGR